MNTKTKDDTGSMLEMTLQYNNDLKGNAAHARCDKRFKCLRYNNNINIFRATDRHGLNSISGNMGSNKISDRVTGMLRLALEASGTMLPISHSTPFCI